MIAEPAWYALPERGTVLGIRISVWLYRRFGRLAARALLVPIVAYFYLTDRRWRAASRDYLERLFATPEGAGSLGRPPGRRDVFRHFLEFGVAILDRVGFWLDDRDRFEVDVVGADELDRVPREGGGAVILGSHLGSFDAMRLYAERSPIKVHLLMYTEHAVRINGIFEVLRWSRMETEGEEFKLNDHYRALYARDIMINEPDLEDFFEIRRRRAV